MSVCVGRNNKHLMTGPEGNSEFCFSRIKGNIEIRGKYSLFPKDQSLSDLLYSKANGSKSVENK